MEIDGDGQGGLGEIVSRSLRRRGCSG